MRIIFSLSSVGIREAEQIKETLISGWITTGFKTKESERLVAICCGVNHAVCLGSQTACAEMTIYLLEIKNTDEIITTDYIHILSVHT